MASLRPRACVVGEHRAAEGVAAGLRDHIDARRAAVGFAGRPTDRDDDFLRGGGVVAELGGAAAVEDRPDIHAVDLNGSLVAVAPPRREHRHPWIRAGIHDLQADAGNRHEEVAHAARGGQRRHDIGTEHRLASRASDVDDWRLTRDRDGLLKVAHTHVGVDGDGAGAGHLDALAHDHGESGERERHPVEARRQRDDAVLPGGIGNGRPRALDEHVARGFDGHARKHGAGRITKCPRERGLRLRHSWKQEDHRERRGASQLQEARRHRRPCDPI